MELGSCRALSAREAHIVEVNALCAVDVGLATEHGSAGALEGGRVRAALHPAHAQHVRACTVAVACSSNRSHLCKLWTTTHPGCEELRSVSGWLQPPLSVSGWLQPPLTVRVPGAAVHASPDKRLQDAASAFNSSMSSLFQRSDFAICMW